MLVIEIAWRFFYKTNTKYVKNMIKYLCEKFSNVQALTIKFRVLNEKLTSVYLP